MSIRTALVFAVIAVVGQNARAEKKDVLAGKIPGLKIENLTTSVLERVKDTEVVVSRITVPPNTALPKHWHPGEEFIYVLEGSATIWLKGGAETKVKAGDVFKVPLKKIHTARTGKAGAKIVVFRVHEKGKPVRVNVE
jgi:quercetin dioxygenase-like cupin family protein